MLKTADERCFFTNEENLPQLIEFARTCEAEISVVKASNPKVQDLPDLAKALCDHQNKKTVTEYEVLEVKIPLPGHLKERKSQIFQAKNINAHIKDTFLANKVVALRDLEESWNLLSKSALSNHITRAKKELTCKGYKFRKIKPGAYVLERTY
jgi:hypothetical protein